MNKQLPKILTTILITILTIVIFFVVIKGKTELSYGWRFGVCFFYGIVIGCLIFILWKTFFKNFPSWAKVITWIFSFISILITIVPDIFYDSFSDVVDNLNDKSNSISLSEELCDSSANKHLVIFAIDKTKYSNTEDISKTQKDAYIRYINSIQRVYKNVPYIDLSKDISYVEFFKAKLCSDLVYLKDTPGKFLVYLIDEDTKRLINEPLPFTEEYITNAIITLFSVDFTVTPEAETDLEDFYINIISVTGEDNTFNQNYFTKYVLYAYSDFVHDKRKVEGFQDEVDNINRYQELLKNKCIIQNLYVIPHKVGETNRRSYILNEKIENPFYKNIIFADKYNPIFYEEDYARYHKIKYLTHKFYTNIQGACSPNLSFLSNRSYIRLTKSLMEGQQIHLNVENRLIFLHDKFQLISKGIVPIQLGTFLPSDKSDIFLDIAIDKGIHGIVKLEFKQSYPKFLKWVLPLFCLMSGFLLVLSICIRKRNLNELNPNL